MGPEFHISIREALTYVFLAALLLTPMIASYSSSLSDSIAIISPVPPSEIPESIEYVGCSLPLPDSNYSYIIILNLEECEVDPHIIEKWIWNHTNYNIIFIIDQSSALYLAGEDRRLLDIPITALQPAPVEAPPPIGEQSGKTLTASHIPGTNITALYAAENNSKIFFLNEKISIQDLLYQLISSSQMEKQQNNITAGNPTTGSPGSRGNMLASPAAILTISALSITTITLLIKMYYFEKYKKIKEKIKKLLSYILILAPRLRGERLLKHPIRMKILKYLEERGYATQRELRKLLNISRASILWHLYLLERDDIISSCTVSKTKIYCLSGRKRKAIRSFLLSNDVRKRIYEIILEEGPVRLSRVAEILNISKSTAKHHLDILERHGLVTKDDSGYRVADTSPSTTSVL